MSEFKPINTQEEFDAAIGERIRREKETAARKYADYDDLKSKAATYESTIADMTKAAEDAAKKYADFDKQLADRDEKIKGYETASVKTRIAHELNIPYELAARLSGDTEDDIRADAESLSKIIGKTYPRAPGKSTEPAGSGATDSKAALRELASKLTNNE